MKFNLKIAHGFIFLVLLNSVHAGTIGPEATNNYSFSPFVSIEGTWTAFNPNLLRSGVHVFSESHGDWGGRLAGGILFFQTNNKFKFTAESGWSYIGKAYKKSSSGTVDLELSGADLLLGILYQPQNYGFFVKGGTLFESANYKVNYLKTGTSVVDGQRVTEEAVIKGTFNQSYILPEMKVGIVYDWNSLGFSLSYAHAFGTSNPFLSLNLNSSNTNNTLNSSVNGRIQGPEINSVLFGAYYKFF